MEIQAGQPLSAAQKSALMQRLNQAMKLNSTNDEKLKILHNNVEAVDGIVDGKKDGKIDDAELQKYIETTNESNIANGLAKIGESDILKAIEQFDPYGVTIVRTSMDNYMGTKNTGETVAKEGQRTVAEASGSIKKNIENNKSAAVAGTARVLKNDLDGGEKLGEDADTILAAMSEALVNHFLGGGEITQAQIDNGSLVEIISNSLEQPLNDNQKAAVTEILQNLFDKSVSKDKDDSSMTLYDFHHGIQEGHVKKFDKFYKDLYIDEDKGTDRMQTSIELLTYNLQDLGGDELGDDAETILPAMSEALINQLVGGNKITKEQIDNGSLVEAFSDSLDQPLTEPQKQIVTNILNNVYTKFASTDDDVEDSLSLVDLEHGQDNLFNESNIKDVRNVLYDKEIGGNNLEKDALNLMSK